MGFREYFYICIIYNVYKKRGKTLLIPQNNDKPAKAIKKTIRTESEADLFGLMNDT